MKNFISLIIAIAIGVGVLGYMRGWFTLQNDPTTGKQKIVVDKVKWQADHAAAKDYLKEKVAGLTKKVESATGAEKDTLQKQVDAISNDIVELDKHHAELGTAGEAKLQELHDKLEKILDKIRSEKAPK